MPETLKDIRFCLDLGDVFSLFLEMLHVFPTKMWDGLQERKDAQGGTESTGLNAVPR